MKRFVLALSLLVSMPALAFDHGHAAWDALLKEHVAWLPGGHASQVSYAGFQQDRAALKAYLDSLSAVSRKEFDGWGRNQRLAFLINACLLYTSPSPRDRQKSRMPSSA